MALHIASFLENMDSTMIVTMFVDLRQLEDMNTKKKLYYIILNFGVYFIILLYHKFPFVISYTIYVVKYIL